MSLGVIRLDTKQTKAASAALSTAVEGLQRALGIY